MSPGQLADLERAVTGFAILHPEQMPALAAIAAPEDYRDEWLRLVWGHLVDLGPGLDVLDLARLVGPQHLPRIGDICGEAASRHTVEAQARLIGEAAQHRRIHAAADEALGRVAFASPADAASVAQEAAEAVAGVAARGTTEEAPQRALDASAPLVAGAADAAMRRAILRARGDESPVPLPRWLADAEPVEPVAKMTAGELLGGGLWPGVYYLVGGTGAGKSQFSLAVALEAARAGVPVLYIALELSRDELAFRLVGMCCRLPWSRLYRGQIQPHDMPALQQARDALRDLPIRIETAGAHSWTYDTLSERVAAFVGAHKGATRHDDGSPRQTPLVVLDYLQIIAGPPKMDVREVMQRTSYACRDAARQHNAAVLVQSSTSRAYYALLRGDGGKDGPPWSRTAAAVLGTGKEAGELEYSADAVLVLAQDPEHKGEVKLAAAKVRAGRHDGLGWFRLGFDGVRFGGVPREW